QIAGRGFGAEIDADGAAALNDLSPHGGRAVSRETGRGRYGCVNRKPDLQVLLARVVLERGRDLRVAGRIRRRQRHVAEAVVKVQRVVAQSENVRVQALVA